MFIFKVYAGACFLWRNRLMKFTPKLKFSHKLLTLMLFGNFFEVSKSERRDC